MALGPVPDLTKLRGGNGSVGTGHSSLNSVQLKGRMCFPKGGRTEKKKRDSNFTFHFAINSTMQIFRSHLLWIMLTNGLQLRLEFGVLRL